jgi:hypothetical protein
MPTKRNLVDAVSDRQVNQVNKHLVKSKRPRNTILLKVCISVICGFMGGFAVGRWIRLI